MFNIEIIIFLVLILFKIINIIKLFIQSGNNKNLKFKKDYSGLSSAQDILKENGLNIYITETEDEKSHYDIGRNVIRMNKSEYNDSNLNSLSVGLYLGIKALAYRKTDKKRLNIISKCLEWSDRLFFILFLLGIYTKDISLMTLSILILIGTVIYNYIYYNKMIDVYEKNIEFIKKNYNLKEKEYKKLENEIKSLFLDNLTVHFVIFKY